MIDFSIPITVFLSTLAFGAAWVIIGATVEVCRWVGAKADILVAAARRYAYRDEIITEHYHPEDMSDRWRIEAPMPYRIDRAKKAAKK